MGLFLELLIFKSLGYGNLKRIFSLKNPHRTCLRSQNLLYTVHGKGEKVIQLGSSVFF